MFPVHLQETLGDQNWIVEYVRSFGSWQINWHLLHKTSQMWHMIDGSIQWVVARFKIMSLDNTCHALSWSRLVWSWNVPVFAFFMPCIAVLWYSQNCAEIFHIWRTCYFLFPFQKHQAANCCLQQVIYSEAVQSLTYSFLGTCIGIIRWWVMWVSALLPWQGPLQIASGSFCHNFFKYLCSNRSHAGLPKGKRSKSSQIQGLI
jgi:hypothetical protein